MQSDSLDPALKSSTQHDAVIEVLRRKGELQTLFRERSHGDVHELVGFSLDLEGSYVSSRELPALLEELETQGRIVRLESVHPYDSSAYLNRWSLRSTSARQT